MWLWLCEREGWEGGISCSNCPGLLPKTRALLQTGFYAPEPPHPPTQLLPPPHQLVLAPVAARLPFGPLLQLVVHPESSNPTVCHLHSL